MSEPAPILSKVFAPWPADDPLHRPPPRPHADCPVCQALWVPPGGMEMQAFLARLKDRLCQPCPACGQPWAWHKAAHPHTGKACEGRGN